MSSVFIFDAYGTLFDVHAAIARHKVQVGPDADLVSAIWRTKQLEYSGNPDPLRALHGLLGPNPARARLRTGVGTVTTNR